MRCYIQILNGEADLVPHFVAHYKRLGATLFPIVTFGSPGDLEAVVSLVIAAGGVPQPLAAFTSEQFDDNFRWEFVGKHHPKGEWGFFPDVDEFANLPPNLFVNNRPNEDAFNAAFAANQFVATNPNVIKSPHFSTIIGRWMDRVSDSGRLIAYPDYFKGDNLEDSFPKWCRTRKRLRLGESVIVLANYAPSNHHPSRLKKADWGKLVCDVHHFKWANTVKQRLHWRLEWLKRINLDKTPWAIGLHKTLYWLNKHNGVERRLLQHAGRVLNIPGPEEAGYRSPVEFLP